MRWFEGLQPWQADANCKGKDTELFFPTRGESNAAAKAICAPCPVRFECLEYAMARPEKDGVWAATSERERRRIRKARAQARRRRTTAA